MCHPVVKQNQDCYQNIDLIGPAFGRAVLFLEEAMRRNNCTGTLFQREMSEFKLLLRSIPATVVTLFVVSVICMNLLANKTLLHWTAAY